MTYDKFTAVSSSAMALDGGSIIIGLTGNEREAHFKLVRSIGSRGTTMYGKVWSFDGNGTVGDVQLLTVDETHRLCHRLRELQGSMQAHSGYVSSDELADFIRIAEQYAV